MKKNTEAWLHSTGEQSIVALFSAKTEISLGEYYASESSHCNSYNHAANETQMAVLGTHRNHRLPLSHCLLERFSQDTPRTTRPPPTSRSFQSPTTHRLPAGTSQDVPGNEQHLPPNTGLPAHVPHDVAVPAVHSNALQDVCKLYGY
jgi:hypothetical protein